jgi:hypothetical protein
LNESPNLGSAQIIITLADGEITVQHGVDLCHKCKSSFASENGSVLAKWIAQEGDWESIWKTIRKLKN